VRRALEIRRAVSSGSLDNLDPQSAAYVAHLDTSAERCAAQDAQDAWTTAVRNISDYTAAYLTAGELEEIWSKVLSSPCYRKWTRSNGRGRNCWRQSRGATRLQS